MNSFINMALYELVKKCPSICTPGRIIYIVYISLCCLILSAQCLNDETNCYCLKEVLSKLRNPIHMELTQIDGEDVYVIAEQPGMVLLYNPRTQHKYKYLDLQERIVSDDRSEEERGLLGFALHPNFTQNKKLYTYSIRNFERECAVVSEIQGTESTINERILLVIEQPTDRRNGGQLLFGVDGYLYVFTGDGGLTSKSNAQEKRSLLGKVLRLDVNTFHRVQNYTIPLNNPFLGVEEWRPEIFALGVRNMWRCSVDRGDPNTGKGKGTMYCGDTGEDLQEEINIITKGSNYGWDYREGAICHKSHLCGTIEGEVLPIKSFNHSQRMTAIVGGPVYRGSSFKHLQGQYLYGDFVSGQLYFLLENNNGTWQDFPLNPCHLDLCDCDSRAFASKHLLAFAEDKEGEVFLLMTSKAGPSETDGTIYRLEPFKNTKSVTCGSNCHGGSLSAFLITAAFLVFYFYSNLKNII